MEWVVVMFCTAYLALGHHPLAALLPWLAWWTWLAGRMLFSRPKGANDNARRN